MTTRLAEAATVTAALLLLCTAAAAVGSASTITINPRTATVCALLAAGPSPQTIGCAALGRSNASFPLLPTVPFASLAGGRDFFCGLRSGGFSFFCWSAVKLLRKRLYSGPSDLSDLTVGEDQIAAVYNNGTGIRWWRGDASFPAAVNGSFRSLTSGRGFTCAINTNSNGTVQCWGRSGDGIETPFANSSMSTIVAGDSHVCGVNTAGLVVCKGSNSSGQLDAPSGQPFEFSGLALGESHTCAVRQGNGTAVCWGGGDGTGGIYKPASNTSFVFLVAGGNLTCGLTTGNFSVVCWTADRTNLSFTVLPFPKILPGICVKDQSSCPCDVFPDSESLCSNSGVICNRCSSQSPPAPPAAPAPPQSPSKKTSKWSLAFVIVGAVGSFAGICSVVYCLWAGVCRHKKVHNSVQPTMNGAAPPVVLSSPMTSPSGSKSRVFRRQSSRVMKRQRSGPSSIKDRAQEFTFLELAAATKDFASGNKIGAGSFGTVYKGKLLDGREVAIKRSETSLKTKKFQEKESAFQSELAFLSRLHHKHLVGFVGFCEERDERLLVYEYMKNGALYDHIHSKNNQSSPVLNSWKMRIKILLDASRGIDYLHNYAVPPIIHRDIKSSNILLDANWVARVSDFGLSLMGPEIGEHLSMRAAGTVGYMDPEYYGLHHLTVKSDVYGFGVVILEVLTGKRAIFKDGSDSSNGGGKPVSVVDYAVPSIEAGDVGRVLDARVGLPGAHEAEAVELVANIAEHCVKLEGRERPTMTDIVANLEAALALCDHSHGSMSSASISLGSFD